MSLHFAYGRTTLSSSDWSITVNTGGGNLTGATKYFSLQAQNPVGKNLQLVSSAITFQTGDSITFTINESALTDAEGWTHYVIGVSDSATTSTFNQIARINIYDLSTGAIDFDTQEVFPLTFTISENSQLETATFVADKLSLPTTNLIYGMRRGVTENNYIYEYNPFSNLVANNDDIVSADVGVWLKKEEFTTYVEDIAQYGGCAYDLYNLTDFSQVELPAYNADGTNSLRVKYYLINNSSFTLQPGTGITLSAQIGGVERTEIFDGKIYYRINGVVTPTDGTLRTTSTITGQTLDFINTDYVYTKANPVTISKDYISNQTGLYIDVYVNFLNLEFNNLLPDGYLQILLSYISPKGVFTPVGTLFEKGIIYNKYNKRRVLPDIGLNAVVGEGEGIVKNFTWYSCNTTISGLTANTANQKLYVNINGVVFPDTAERASSVLRAIVDTTPKESRISTWTNYSAVTADSALTVSVDYECDSDLNQQIRDTYPDVIAGDWSIFNPTRLNIYVQRESDGEIRKFTGFIPAGNNVSQDFIITDWSSGTVVGSVPSTSASFFDPTTNTFSTISSSGNFTSGNYRVAHSYVWNGDTVSDISHSVAEGCIAESQINGEQVFGTTTYNTIAQIKAESDVYDGLRLYCKNTQQLYVYDENSIETADEYDVLLPNSNVGRWLNVAIGRKPTVIKEVAPTIDDDSSVGYIVGHRWINIVTEKEYILFDNTVGAAVWKLIPQTATDIGLGNVNNTSDANKPISNATQVALDLKINTSLIGAVDGVCPLDGGGKVDAVYLPSYVDDVLEYADLASLPVTGETGKIYITLDTNKAYRWTGSVYIEITSDPLPAQTGHNGKFLTTNGTVASWSVVSAANVTVDTTNFNNNLSGTDTTVQAALETLDDLVASGSSGLTSVYTTDVTLAATAGNMYLLNGTTTANLPAGVNGDRIGFADYLPNFFANPVTINPNGAETIAGLASLTLDNDRDCIELLFQTDRWVITSLESFADSVATPNIVSRGSWDSATNYNVNDIVNYAIDGNTYIANTANINKVPGTDPEWDIFFTGSISGGGHVIEDEGIALTQRTKLNFVGDAVTVTDDAGNDRTIVTVNASTAGREVLTANRTYYVRTDGSDSNDGLSNTSGGAFATIQKARQQLLQIDGNGFNGTIQLGDGIYTLTETIFLNGFVGFSKITIQGNAITPSNVEVTTTTINDSNLSTNTGLFVVNGANTCIVLIKDLKVSCNVASGFTYLIRSLNSGYLQLSGIDFGAASSSGATIHINPLGGIIEFVGGYTISGGANYHCFSARDGLFTCQFHPVSIINTPNFPVSFLTVIGGQAYVNGNTYTGSATGKRYEVSKVGYIQVSGAGANYLPGNVAGTVESSTFGVYA